MIEDGIKKTDELQVSASVNRLTRSSILLLTGAPQEDDDELEVNSAVFLCEERDSNGREIRRIFRFDEEVHPISWKLCCNGLELIAEMMLMAMKHALEFVLCYREYCMEESAM